MCIRDSLLAEAGPDAADALRVDVELDDVTRTRESFPVLPDRRF